MCDTLYKYLKYCNTYEKCRKSDTVKRLSKQEQKECQEQIEQLEAEIIKLKSMMGKHKHGDKMDECIRIRKQRGEEDMMILNVVRGRVLLFMFAVIFVGLLVPFAAQWFPLSFIPWDTHAEIWNNYVSIILGIIATLCSLLSIYLAFYAQNQTTISNNNTIDDFNMIRKEIKESSVKMTIIEEKTNRILDDLYRLDPQNTSTVRPSSEEMLNAPTEDELFDEEETEI